MDTMHRPRTFALALERLRRVGLRPTRQRLALAKLLFEQGDRHVTAEQLHEEAVGAKVRVSLATVYNSLHQFTQMGLLRDAAAHGDQPGFMAAAGALSTVIDELNAVDPRPIITSAGVVSTSEKGIDWCRGPAGTNQFDDLGTLVGQQLRHGNDAQVPAPIAR